MSFLSPQQPWDDDLIASFCCFAQFFASPEAGSRWVGEHPGTFLLSLADAFEVGRRFNVRRLGAALDARDPDA